mgnify:CR=1 FL=1
MGIASIVNWLGDAIDDGDANAALYVAEINHDPSLITIGHCALDQVDHLHASSSLGRLRYITSADPEIFARRSSLSLKDCWLGEQFLLFQLSDYRENLNETANVDAQNYIETFKLPETGASRFIEWIAETSQKIFCHPHSGYKLCLDTLVTTSRQRLLYEKVKMQWMIDT